MSRVRAPGKLVISGAYSVLEGAPAVVTAVDRYVEADDARPARFITDEMRAAMSEPFPDFDATALRDGARKLGLGSSAAILVATLAVKTGADLSDSRSVEKLFERALQAHRAAQGGGSGIDVAASVFGGTLQYQLSEPSQIQTTRDSTARVAVADTPLGKSPTASRQFTKQQRFTKQQWRSLRLPRDVVVDVWASPHAASTSRFIAAVYAWRERAAAQFDELFTVLRQGAERVVDALGSDDSAAFVEGLMVQATQLARLGDLVGIPIIGSQLRSAMQLAAERSACLIPAGAGGGDVTLLVQPQNPMPELHAALRNAGLEAVPLRLEARGVHAVDS